MLFTAKATWGRRLLFVVAAACTGKSRVECAVQRRRSLPHNGLLPPAYDCAFFNTISSTDGGAIEETVLYFPPPPLRRSICCKPDASNR